MRHDSISIYHENGIGIPMPAGSPHDAKKRPAAKQLAQILEQLRSRSFGNSRNNAFFVSVLLEGRSSRPAKCQEIYLGSSA